MREWMKSIPEKLKEHQVIDSVTFTKSDTFINTYKFLFLVR